MPIIGSSEAIRTLRNLIELIAHSSSTALVTGESGTGKELVAQALHAVGPRALGPFVPINCGAIPRELIESELFGHRKGSFTGALNNRLGRFELAHGGTLFLDEIGDLPMDMQVKLLRVLQERRILPVGADTEVPVDVRVIAATHKDLDEEVRAGRFREDLYYRLNVLPLRTTPLRDRRSDIAELLEFYAQRYGHESGRALTFTADMVALLCEYDWPGNVRELANLTDRFSTLFAGKCIDVGTVPTAMLPAGLARLQQDKVGRIVGFGFVAGGRAADEAFTDPEAVFVPDEASKDGPNPVEQAVLLAHGIRSLPLQGISLKRHLVEIERSLIEQALHRAEGNVTQTAKLLQLQRTTLIEKINKYGMRAAGA